MQKPFDINSEETQEFLAECAISTELFARTFFEDLFPRQMSRSLRRFYDVLDDDSLTRVLCILPRGIGKTTTIKFGFIVRRMLFEISKYVLYLSETSTLAVGHGSHIRNRLIANPLIKQLWPDLKTKKFAEMEWHLSNGGIFFPRGDSQQVRGASGDTRPDLIIADDVESPVNCKNSDTVNDRIDWWDGTVLNCLNRDSETDRVLVVGTRPANHSLISLLEDSNDYTNVIFDLVDPNTMESNFPEFLSTEKCNADLEAARAHGTEDEWWRENTRYAHSQKNKTFRSDFYRDYDEVLEKGELIQYMSDGRVWKKEDSNSLLTMVICDPARETNPNSAESAVTCIGVRIDPAAIYIRDVFSGKVEPDEMFEEAAKMCLQYGAIWAGLEKTGLGKYGTNPFRAYLHKAGVNVEILELNAGPDRTKAQRMLDIHPFYKAGVVWHRKGKCTGLELQLEAYPTGRYNDIIDTLPYIIKILEDAGITLNLAPPEIVGRDIKKELEDLDIHPEDLYTENNIFGGYNNALV